MKFYYILLVVTLCFISCKSEWEDTSQKTEQIAQDSLLFGEDPVGYPKLQFNAQEILKDWPIFQEFQKDARLLESLSLNNLKAVSEKMLSQTDSLSKSIPDTLQAQAIRARLLVVKTQISLLNQEANRGKILPENIEKSILESRLAISNFFLQLNEKLQKDGIDLQRKEDEEKELEKQQKARDSIFQLELQDQ